METTLEKLLETIDRLHPDGDPSEKNLIVKAFEFSEQAHTGQLRKNGEPYFNHVYATAMILAELHADATTIAAGLLHDVIEDTTISENTLRTLFGDDITHLVLGVTKLGHLKYQGVHRYAESLRKFFIASASDIRVVAIKLADRLGMGRLKAALEDLAFPFAYPDEYKKTKEILQHSAQLDENHLAKVAANLKEELSILEANVSSLDYRVKHLYSTWVKLHHKNYDITKIYDIFALRILVPTIADCYHSLGIIHGLYKPLPGKFKDYIAMPKANGYQSLHTTVFDGQGGVVEIQIRTELMHQEAEYGIYSHVGYKERGKRGTGSMTSAANWTKQLLEA